jgi:hypothetical protein
MSGKVGYKVELEKVNEKNIKLGYLYCRVNDRLQYVFFVCVGKCIALKEAPYIFASVNFPIPYTDEQSSILSEAIRLFKAGKYSKYINLWCKSSADIMREVQYMGTLTIFSGVGMYVVGKLLEPNEICGWFAQLKLAGFSFSNTTNVSKYGYIGDWETRDKLPCVDKFEVGGTYIKEPLAYVRKDNHLFESWIDAVWVYKGKKKRGDIEVYVWEERICTSKSGLVVKHHTSKYQYSDMVKFNEDEWNYKTR